MRRDRLNVRRTPFKIETRAWAIAASGKLGALAFDRSKPLCEEGAVLEIEGKGRARALKLLRPPAGEGQVLLLGRVAAGAPIEPIETPAPVEVPRGMLRRAGDHFALRVRGDSMVAAGILDGDLVVVRRQTTAEEGETVVALSGRPGDGEAAAEARGQGVAGAGQRGPRAPGGDRPRAGDPGGWGSCGTCEGVSDAAGWGAGVLGRRRVARQGGETARPEPFAVTAVGGCVPGPAAPPGQVGGGDYSSSSGSSPVGSPYFFTA